MFMAEARVCKVMNLIHPAGSAAFATAVTAPSNLLAFCCPGPRREIGVVEAGAHGSALLAENHLGCFVEWELCGMLWCGLALSGSVSLSILFILTCPIDQVFPVCIG